MKRFLSNSWWMLVVRGPAALVSGILALAWPGLSPGIAIGVLVLILGIRVRSLGRTSRQPAHGSA